MTEKDCLFFLSEKAKFRNRDFTEVSAEFWHILSITMQRWNAHMIRSRIAYQATICDSPPGWLVFLILISYLLLLSACLRERDLGQKGKGQEGKGKKGKGERSLNLLI